MKTKQSCVHHQYRPHLAITLLLLLAYGFIAYWIYIHQLHPKIYQASVTGNPVKVLATHQGIVSDILVKEHDLVVEGQPIATINRPNAYITLKKAETTLQFAIQQVADMYHTTNQIQLRAQTELKTAENALSESQKHYQTLLNAYNDQKPALKESLKQAQIAVEKATNNADDARLHVNMAMSLPNDFNIYENPIVTQAMDQLRTAYFDWLQTIIYAPYTGYIHQTHTQVGDTIDANTTLVSLIPINELWINANISKEQAKNLRYGQLIQLKSNQNNFDFTGKIIGFNAKNNGIQLQIQINADQLAKHPLSPGMLMTATINVTDRIDATPYRTESHKIMASIANDNNSLAPAEQMIQEIVLQTAGNTPLLADKR